MPLKPSSVLVLNAILWDDSSVEWVLTLALTKVSLFPSTRYL
jgi:hypothetical protein